jgi:uncharacterized membrane protein
MKKNVIERLEDLKSSSSYDTAKGRAFIDLIIYKLENKLPIEYYPKNEILKNRIVKIVKDFDISSKKPIEYFPDEDDFKNRIENKSTKKVKQNEEQNKIISKTSTRKVKEKKKDED